MKQDCPANQVAFSGRFHARNGWSEVFRLWGPSLRNHAQIQLDRTGRNGSLVVSSGGFPSGKLGDAFRSPCHRARFGMTVGG